MLGRVGRFSDVRRRILEERQSRLNPNLATLPVNAAAQLSAFRNICTIAHIDAGKTTLTERLLYGCGAIGELGEVHEGTALMDFTEEERKRGITINSACITFMWKKVHINLIDTPGHADFNFEVERSLKVLNGALVIIDAVKGVEAQTRMVWQQANKYGVTKVVVMNKMDKMGADYLKSIENVEQSFNIKVFPAFVPVFKKDDFIGIIDIFGRQYYSWTNYPNEKKVPPRSFDEFNVSEKYYRTPLILADFSEEVQKEYFKSLERIIEYLSVGNESLAEEFLMSIEENGLDVKSAFIEKLFQEVKRLIVSESERYTVSLPASALKNKGIQTSLDAIITYLPPPREVMMNNTNPLVFVFKRVLDPNYGILAFAKIITGKLSKSATLNNINSQSDNKSIKIYRIQANEYAEMDEASSGDIVALGGLKNFSAGDNLLLPGTHRALERVLVKGFEKREPVYHVSIDFQTVSDQDKFMTIIEPYILEDPSISFGLNKETGQYVISGQGELHIETKFNRIFREHGIKLNQGRVNVSFKETVSGSNEVTYTFQRMAKQGLKYLQVKLRVESVPQEEFDLNAPPTVEVDLFDNNPKAKDLYKEYTDLIEELEQLKKEKAQEATASGQTDSNLPAKKGSKGHSIASKSQLEKLPENAKFMRINLIHNPTEMQSIDPQFKFTEDIINDLYHLSALSFPMLYELQKSLQELTVRGPLTSSPLVNTKITIVDGSFNPKFIDPIIVRMTASEAFSAALNSKNCALLEPMVEVQITCRNDSVNEIISNASSVRKGKMGQIITSNSYETEFTVNIPLLSSINYANYLRGVTNGEVRMSMKNSGYSRVSMDRQELILKAYN